MLILQLRYMVGVERIQRCPSLWITSSSGPNIKKGILCCHSMDSLLGRLGFQILALNFKKTSPPGTHFRFPLLPAKIIFF
jgi:hypothetical protein